MTENAGLRAIAGDALPVISAVTALSRAHSLIMRQVNAALRTTGISYPQFQILHLLYSAPRGALPLSILSERLAVHPASLTHTVNRLEQGGLVHRSSHPSDGRTTLAVLTADGVVRLSRAGSTVAEHIDGSVIPSDLPVSLEAALRSVLGGSASADSDARQSLSLRGSG